MNRGRPREFDKTEALEKAMLLFWRNGYRGVSLDDLTQTLGVNKPSLYAAFGDKESLFLQVVDHYRGKLTGPLYKELLAAPKLAEGLGTFLKGLCKAVTSKEHPGCLIACVLTQEAADSEAMRDKLAESLAGTDKGFTQLMRDHASELRAGFTPEDAAKFLTSTIHGMSVRARSGASAQELEPIGAFVIQAICK